VAACFMAACAGGGSRTDPDGAVISLDDAGALPTGIDALDGGVTILVPPPLSDAETETAPDTGVSDECAERGPDGDDDGDGFTPRQGDCNDCSGQINPGAYEIPGNDYDEDCDGSAASEEEACDATLALDSADARDAARALGLCRFVREDSLRWGVISAAYRRLAGDAELDGALQTGILPAFGAAVPRAGARMLALSSGVARAPGQPGFGEDCGTFYDACGCAPSDGPCRAACRPGSPSPAGYPKQSTECAPGPVVDEPRVYNDVVLELRIRVPSNARSLAFDSVLYTHEYPESVCLPFNDTFVALLSPRAAGVVDDNIVFDEAGNAVTVNTSLFSVCTPGSHGGRTFSCPGGTTLLADTGFDEPSPGCAGSAATASPGGSTGWLHTTSPVTPGSVITMRWALWDALDPYVDSTVLLDGFAWSVDEPVVKTRPVILL
jgi:hypothetical protein